MINIHKGLQDYNELRTTIRGVKDINSLVELIYDNPKYDITNDLRDTSGLIEYLCYNKTRREWLVGATRGRSLGRQWQFRFCICEYV